MCTIGLALEMGKATVLKILHASEVPIKPTGRHIDRQQSSRRSAPCDATLKGGDAPTQAGL
jgi:hypothetical protein